MKKILALVFALAMGAHSAPVLGKQLGDNKGQSLALFGAQRNTAPVMGAAVNLDTAEIDTSYYFYELISKPVISFVDTVGWIHFTGKDSTGTDSCRVRLIWYGNSRADGQGIWAKIDSVTYSASGSAASAYASGTPTAVVNSKGYQALMFTVSNPSTSAVALKSAAKDIVLNRPKRGLVFE